MASFLSFLSLKPSEGPIAEGQASGDKGLCRVGGRSPRRRRRGSLQSDRGNLLSFPETGGGFRQQRRKLRSAPPVSLAPGSGTSASKKQSLVLTAVATVSSPCHYPVGRLFCPGLELPKSP